MRRMAFSSGDIAGSSESWSTAASRPSFQDSTVSCVWADGLFASARGSSTTAVGVTASCAACRSRKMAARSCGRRSASSMLVRASAWASQTVSSTPSGASSTDSSTDSARTLRAPRLSRAGVNARMGTLVTVAIRTEPSEGDGEGEQVEKSV